MAVLGVTRRGITWEKRSTSVLLFHARTSSICGIVWQSLTKRCCPMPDSSYYASSAWRRKRQERLDHDGHQCQGCGITRDQLEQLGWPSLQVHHKNAGPPDFTYPSFGNEQISDLLTLCTECHDGITNSVRRQRYKLDPKKQVEPVLVATSSLYVPTLKSTQNVSASYCTNPFPGREPTAVPQRSNRRSSQSLFQGNQGDFGQAQKD
jgi:5-methylcytosine-specific restriction endonuclease McrA